MKNIRLLLASVCCFAATSFGMEEKKPASAYPQHHEIYDRMINKLITTPESNLAKHIDRIAPEIRETLSDIIGARKDDIKAGKQKCSQPIFNKLNSISAALEKSLGKSVEEGISQSEKIYNKNDLYRILEDIIETDRSEVHEKVKTFDPQLKKALIGYIEEMIPNFRTNKSPEIIRLLNKINFISDALQQN